MFSLATIILIEFTAAIVSTFAETLQGSKPAIGLFREVRERRRYARLTFSDGSKTVVSARQGKAIEKQLRESGAVLRNIDRRKRSERQSAPKLLPTYSPESLAVFAECQVLEGRAKSIVGIARRNRKGKVNPKTREKLAIAKQRIIDADRLDSPPIGDYSMVGACALLAIIFPDRREDCESLYNWQIGGRTREKQATSTQDTESGASASEYRAQSSGKTMSRPLNVSEASIVAEFAETTPIAGMITIVVFNSSNEVIGGFTSPDRNIAMDYLDSQEISGTPIYSKAVIYSSAGIQTIEV